MGAGAVLCRWQEVVGQDPGPDRRSAESRSERSHQPRAARHCRVRRQAIDYWNRLLAQLPADDNSRAALQGGIERATERLQASGGKLAAAPAAKVAALLRVDVDLASELRSKVQPGDSVFIFARATSGPPAPLAAKRLTVADLPVTVELGDADAMMPQLKLSNFPEVQLVARISRAGQPTAGEWVGRSGPLASSTTALQKLIIDSPDK